MIFLRFLSPHARSTLFSKQNRCRIKEQKRNVQVAIVGAASDIGKNTALLLKQNQYINKLHLYDDSEKVKGIGLELSHIPGGPSVSAFCGDMCISDAIQNAHLVVMVSRMPRKLGYTREQMLATNAISVQKLCRTIAYLNPEAFLALSTNPINAMVPFASALLVNYNSYNPNKLFGITHIDTTRARALLGKAINVNPKNLYVPVIGGHSDETIIPLFSNISPSHHSVKPCQADTLTRLVKKCGTEVLNHKLGNDSATLAVAWSINEFVENIVEAIYGKFVIVNCYTANKHFGTKFFSGPTRVDAHGIIETCSSFKMSDLESKLLERAVPMINRDIAQGEDHVRVVENAPNL